MPAAPSKPGSVSSKASWAAFVGLMTTGAGVGVWLGVGTGVLVEVGEGMGVVVAVELGREVAEGRCALAVCVAEKFSSTRVATDP